jgi:hypothetical protein
MPPTALSKSRMAAGLQCHKRLWSEIHQSNLVAPVSFSQQAIFDQGHEVGRWSHRLFPDGMLLEGELDFAVHLQRSREALSLRKPLFELAFSVPGAYARADILVPEGITGWDLLEVKSASNVWEKDGSIKLVYLQDIAFQLYVFRTAGLEIRRASLVFLNRDYVRHGEIDPQTLFRQEDVTVQAEALVPFIPGQLQELSKLLQQTESPSLEIGPHCHAPYDCSLIDHCWKAVPLDSVFTLTRAGVRSWAWWKAGIEHVGDLPTGEKYSFNQAVQIAAERSGTPHLDKRAIEEFLEGLRYPRYYVDFETVMPGVPLFDGCRPYAQVPFQFSLHVQQAPGQKITHVEFLADGAGDPRVAFLVALRANLGTEGSIITYNASFELQRMRELALQVPQYAGWVAAVLPRFDNADLLAPFRKFSLYDPRQHGSASLKAVLPAFTELNYDGLAIQEGGTASNQFLRLLQGLIPSQEVGALRKNLLAYCELDTCAMVELVDALARIQRHR